MRVQKCVIDGDRSSGCDGGAAKAQGAATQQINLTANVGGYCTINGTSTAAPRSSTVTTANGRVAAGVLTLSGVNGQVICTQNAKIQLSTLSGGMTNSGTPPNTTDYTNKIHYTVTASYNGVTDTLTTTDSTGANFTTLGTTSTLGPQTNQPLALEVSTLATPANKFLFSGAYTDTITVTLSPNP